jgi:uncharacterized repeat protein (TIGR01451 family)
MTRALRLRPLAAVAVFAALACGSARPAAAQYSIDWHTVDGGGAMNTSGGTFEISGTAGQPDAGASLNGGNFTAVGGFWAIVVFAGPTADLFLTKDDMVAALVPGLPVSYVIVASNGSSAQAVSGATVSDTLDAALLSPTWTCTASSGSACSASGSGNINDSVNLAPLGTVTYTLNATVDPAARGSLANTATIAIPPGGVDPNANNNTATDTDTLTPQADLAMALSDNPDPVGQGRTLHYTLTVNNAGPSSALLPTLTDTLPAGTFLLSVPPGCTPAGSALNCDLADVAPGGTATLTLDVAVAQGPGSVLTDTASVTGVEPDPNRVNNSASEDTQVIAPRDGELVHGSRLVADLAANGPVPNADWYRISQKPHASYEVVVDATSGDLGTGTGPLVERVTAAGILIQDSVAAGAGSSRSLRFENNGTSAVDTELVRVRSAACTTDCTSADVYQLRAFETTASIARFNNSASQVTVLVLQNTTSAPVTGKIDFWDAGSSLLASTSFTLTDHQALTLNTSTIPEVAGHSGSITVTNDAPYGALAGKAVAVEPSTGFTFDTELRPRPR